MTRGLELNSPSKSEFLKNIEGSDKDINSKVSELTKWLYDDDIEKQRVAATRLGDIAKHYPDEVVYACDKLRHLIKSSDDRVKTKSLKTLIYVGTSNPDEIRTVVGASIPHLYDENAKLRELAIYSLIVAIDFYPDKVRPAIPRLIEFCCECVLSESSFSSFHLIRASIRYESIL